MSYTQNNELPPILGNGWEKIFDNGGSSANLSVNLDELLKLPFTVYNNKKYVKLILKKTKEPNANSKATHIIVEDTYQSQKLTNGNNSNTNNIQVPKVDLPF